VKNKNNVNSLNSTSKFQITFLISIFALILITATLTLNIKGAVIFAQDNNSTNSTGSLQSDNQTTGVDNDPHSKFPYKSALDLVQKHHDDFTATYTVNSEQQHKSLGTFPQSQENESR